MYYTLENLDDFELPLYCNEEVLSINQDTHFSPAKPYLMLENGKKYIHIYKCHYTKHDASYSQTFQISPILPALEHRNSHPLKLICPCLLDSGHIGMNERLEFFSVLTMRGQFLSEISSTNKYFIDFLISITFFYNRRIRYNYL